MKLLSIAVPSYNVERYLTKTLSSLNDERFKTMLQVIIVDDGSQDSTSLIAQQFVNICPEIFTLITKINGGHGSTINAALKIATGKYFRVLDGDDWINTEALYDLLIELKKNKISCDLIYNPYRTVHMETGEEIFYPLPKKAEIGNIYDEKELHTIIKSMNFPLTCTIYNTALLKTNKIALLENTFYVDIEFLIKAISNVKTTVFLNFDIYRYLIGNSEQSINMKNQVNKVSHHVRVLESCLLFIENNSFSNLKKMFLTKSINSISRSIFKLMLIFNENRKLGREQAVEIKNLLLKYKSLNCSVLFSYYLLLFFNVIRVNSKVFLNFIYFYQKIINWSK